MPTDAHTATDQIVTLREAAAHLRRPVGTIRDWATSGKIRPIQPAHTRGRFGGKIPGRFLMKEIASYAASIVSPTKLIPPDGYMECQEAAKMLGFQWRGCIRQRIIDGTLRGIKVPFGVKQFKWYVFRADVESEISRRKKRAEPEPIYHPHPLIAASDALCIAARRQKLEQDGIRTNFEKLIDEWKRVG